MGRTRIKICGLTRAEDVRAAVDAGADACGFVLARSFRQVSLERLSELAALVPPPVARIGVFVDADAEFVEQAVAAGRLSAVQFSGGESPFDCDRSPVPVLKTIAIGTDFGLERAEPFRGHAAALLLDTYHPHQAGGTAQTFDWRDVGELPGWAPVFVAGGLDGDNVGTLIATLHPYAVDVSSGVESAPGIKDPAKITAFCDAVREADEKEYR